MKRDIKLLNSIGEVLSGDGTYELTSDVYDDNINPTLSFETPYLFTPFDIVFTAYTRDRETRNSVVDSLLTTTHISLTQYDLDMTPHEYIAEAFVSNISNTNSEWNDGYAIDVTATVNNWWYTKTTMADRGMKVSDNGNRYTHRYGGIRYGSNPVVVYPVYYSGDIGVYIQGLVSAINIESSMTGDSVSIPITPRGNGIFWLSGVFEQNGEVPADVISPDYYKIYDVVQQIITSAVTIQLVDSSGGLHTTLVYTKERKRQV